mgnify:CR=1 FL=1
MKGEEEIEESQKEIFSFPAEGAYATGTGTLMVLAMIVGCALFIFSFKLILMLIGFGSLYLVYRFLKFNILRTVTFYQDKIVVVSALKHKYVIPYEIVSSVTYHPNSHQFEHVYKVKYNKAKNRKSITFHCDRDEFKEVASFLREKGVLRVFENEL